MKSTIQTLAFLAALSTTASAAIGLGIKTVKDRNEQVTVTENVAWISGDDPCGTAVDINLAGSDPCGTQFTLNNGFTYFEQNCGTSQYSLANGDGSFNSACTFFTDHGHQFICEVSAQGDDAFPSTFVTQSYVCG